MRELKFKALFEIVDKPDDPFYDVQPTERVGEKEWRYIGVNEFHGNKGDKKLTEWLQLTGLKDKNCKVLDWYDGDILQCLHFKEVNKTHYLLHVIVWSNVHGAWLAISKEFYGKDHSLKPNGNLQLNLYNKVSEGAKLIGNIHTTPELLTS